MKVSIVTPNLNSGDSIERTIRSVIAQDYSNIELIIVDGGSTDNSYGIIQEYHRLHPTLIRWISEPDKGVYQALNRGLALATGDVTGTLHAGDYLCLPSIVSTIASTMAREPETPFIYGDVHYFQGKNERCVRLYSGTESIESALRRGIAPPHPSLYMRRSAIDVVGGYREDYVIAADYELFVRMVLVHGLKGRYLPVDMVAMSLGGLSTKFKNRLITNNREKMRALRENGISRTGLGIFRRYFINPLQ